MTEPQPDEASVVEGRQKKLELHVFADVICPWCWLGERRLRRVLAERSDLDVTAHWQPYQLSPNTPLEGESFQSVINNRLGGIESAKENWAVIEEAGATEGLTYRFDLITRFPNSRRAHELILFAGTVARTWITVDTLCHANFAEGLDISDIDTLLEIARNVGLDVAQVREVFADERYIADVFASQQQARDLGISGVPFFVLNEQFGVSGAQPEELFRRAIATAVDDQ